MEKKIIRKLQYSGSGAQFSSFGKYAEVWHPRRFVHKFSQNYYMKMVEGLFKKDFYSSHDGEKKIPKTIIFRVGGPNITFGQICINLVFCQILGNVALLLCNL